MKSAFLTPIYTQSIVRQHYRTSIIPLHMSLMSSHPYYDVLAVSTYAMFCAGGYWLGDQRANVDFVAAGLGLLWQLTLTHNPNVFYYLWLVGGISYLVSQTQLEMGNSDGASQFRVGVQLGGYLSFFLLIMDLFDVIVEKL